MPKYPYPDIGYEQFQRLIETLCKKIFGSGFERFSEGKDGGIDGRMIGTANEYPSLNSPWTGITVMQAKHTSNWEGYFSDPHFFGNKTSTVAEEVPKILKLIKEGKLNNYLLVSNRKGSPQAKDKIVEHIMDSCNLQRENVHIWGIEQIESYLEDYPEVAIKAKVDPSTYPLNISPDLIRNILEEFLESSPNIFKESFPVKWKDYSEKNKINNLPEDLEADLNERYLKYTDEISRFLQSSTNTYYRQSYVNFCEELNLKIYSFSNEFDNFGQVFDFLFDQLTEKSAFLRKMNNRKYVKLMLYFMYWNCDIGKRTKDDTPLEA